MSPKTRAVYKDFSHKLRSKDTQSKGMRHAQALAQRSNPNPHPDSTPTPTPNPNPTPNQMVLTQPHEGPP